MTRRTCRQVSKSKYQVLRSNKHACGYYPVGVFHSLHYPFLHFVIVPIGQQPFAHRRARCLVTEPPLQEILMHVLARMGTFPALFAIGAMAEAYSINPVTNGRIPIALHFTNCFARISDNRIGALEAGCSFAQFLTSYCEVACIVEHDFVFMEDCQSA